MPGPRFGHIIAACQNKIYIFGGEAKYSNTRRKREMYNDIYEFDTLTSSYRQIEITDILPSGRKHHAACMLGKDIIIHGGIDQSGQIINELLMFDTVNHKWNKVQMGNLEFNLMFSQKSFKVENDESNP